MFFDQSLIDNGPSLGWLPGNPLITSKFTFATLPPPVEGMIATISDSTQNTWGTIASGGGTFAVAVYYDGTNWIVWAK
jgi:hypothetical protein